MPLLAPAHEACIADFVERFISSKRSRFKLTVVPLRGGLESESVLRVQVRATTPQGANHAFTFVVKTLRGPSVREASVYETLSCWAPTVAPRLLSIIRGDESTLLFIDSIPRSDPWPWHETLSAQNVLVRLANFHASRVAATSVEHWDYERELQAIAEYTLDRLRGFAARSGDAKVRAIVPTLRRFVANLPSARARLLSQPGLPATFIHGDVHPGNVLMTPDGTALRPVFVDWARARLGSPLEDVSSWIEWLRFWEPTAERTFDILLARYLSTRGLPSQSDRSLGRAYWTAAALNCCSGALSYHLERAEDPGLHPKQRGIARGAIHHCVNMLRNADWSHSRASRSHTAQ
jgi:hypothetical protein